MAAQLLPIKGDDSFIVDADRFYSVAASLGVHASPALVVFYKARPVKVKREGWEEDYKCIGYTDVGLTSEENFRSFIDKARAFTGSGMGIMCE